jgi:hypothetical protein
MTAISDAGKGDKDGLPDTKPRSHKSEVLAAHIGSSNRPAVIYVMGAGRSGSTILGVALGNCDGVFYAGELDAWLRRSGIPNFGGAERLGFWRRVRDAVSAPDDLLGKRAWRSLEHSASVFRPAAWCERRRIRNRYRHVAARLYRSIAAISGAYCIVDTSHYPLRALALQGLGDVDLYLVYLVRDPHAVVASFARKEVDQPSKGALAANAYLTLTHFLSVLVFLRHRRDRRLFLRYEDFAQDPTVILTQLLGSSRTAATAPDYRELKTGIPFQGNRLLNSRTVCFEMGRSAKSRRMLITTATQSPWRWVFALLRPRPNFAEDPGAVPADV